MNSEQLRTALHELHGDRDVTFAFARVYDVPGYGVNGHLHIKNAMLIPTEADGLVKLTDGKRVYIIVSELIAWVSIG